MESKRKLVPPDGGWGWAIVFAYSLSNIIVIPLMQGFGLVFQETFSKLNMSAMDSSIIINVNSAFGMAMGLINGPLLKRFGFRKVALVGAGFIFTGVTLTSFANSFVHFLITYSLITSLGFGLSLSSFSLALNSYFLKNRNKAAGIGLTFTGLGPIFFPYIISYLLKKYDVMGCVLILGGFSAHAFVAALFLQPLKWHMKPAPGQVDDTQTLEKIEEGDEEKEDDNNPAENINNGERKKSIVDNILDMYVPDAEENQPANGKPRVRKITLATIDYDDTQSIYGFEAIPRRGSDAIMLTRPTPPIETLRKRHLSLSRSISQDQTKKRWFESGSLETVNLGSSVKIFDEKSHAGLSLPEINESEKDNTPETLLIPQNDEQGKSNIQKMEFQNINTNEAITAESAPDSALLKKKEKVYKRAVVTVVKLFDLDLLKDPVYVILMLGMSLAIFAEINFSLLTPFILKDMNFTTDQMATVMSSLAITDIVSRFFAPFIGDYFKQTPKMMYMYSLILLVIMRSGVFFANTFSTMLAVGLGLGMAKGVRIVYMSLVIPSYVPIERLASASGIQMLVNGLFLLIFGPLLGAIRDATGSYTLCIVFINIVTCLTLVMWTIEILFTNYKERRKSKEVSTKL